MDKWRIFNINKGNIRIYERRRGNGDGKVKKNDRRKKVDGI